MTKTLEPRPSSVDWADLVGLRVVDKLRQIVRRRFDAEVGIADAGGRLVSGDGELAPCAAAAWRALGQGGVLRYTCPRHQRVEFASAVVLDGQRVGVVFAGAARHQDDDFLGELVELCAVEMQVFSADIRRRERAAHGAYTPRHVYDGIIGRGQAITELYRLLDKIVDSESTVLITGENGTGKELIARAIHYHSPRVGERLVMQNCSAFNDNLLDSELFGHKKGAFTGAIADKQGLFEVADKGTFFLDEIGDMSPALQVKVLRVLQEGTFTPVGDTQPRHVDVRIIAATNRDLKRMVEEAQFREDLYYRINVISLVVPPLRERKDDIPLLIEHFLRRAAGGSRLKQKRLSPACLAAMVDYAWPGNVRELENEIERLIVLAGDDKIVAAELLSPRIQPQGRGDADADAPSLSAQREALERSLIQETLQRHQGNKTRAAEELHMSRRNLIRKTQKYKL